MDGYIRDMALDKFREVEDLVETNGMKIPAALRSAAIFPERGPYFKVWGEWWKNEVLAGPKTVVMAKLLGPIEVAVRGALLEERERRVAADEPTIEDTLHYKAFVDRAMENLLDEASGEIEEF